MTVAAPQRRRQRRSGGWRRARDWLKLLLLLSFILWIGLGEPLKQIDSFFDVFGYH